MDQLAVQLAQLENAQLVRRAADEEMAYLFKHALTQEAAYETLLVKKRREIHRRVAETYEQVYPDELDKYAPLLAHQYGEAGNDVKAVKYAILAGDLAARLYALPEAVLFSAQALAGLARLPDTEDNRRRRIDLILKRAPISWVAQAPERNFALLTEAETLARTLPDENGKPGGDRLRLARVHYMLGSAHMARNELGATVSYLEQVQAEAQGLGDLDLLTLPSIIIGASKALQGHFIEAERLLTVGLEQMEPSTSFDRWEWTGAVSYLSFTLAARGQVEAGLALAERGLTVIRVANNLSYLALLQFFLALTYLLSGNPQRAGQVAGTAVANARQSGSQMYVYFGLALETWAESRLGQHTAAMGSLAQAKVVAQQLGPQLLFGDWFAAVEAEIALNAGRIDVALELGERAVTLAQSVEGTFAEALAQRVCGQALVALFLSGVEGPPHWEQAEAHLAASLELFKLGGATLEAARTHVAWGQLLHARGDADAAREHFEKAAAQFQVSGLVSELEQTRHLIDSLST
jgi:tetratricopeptide (TPR) repeat protein